MVWGDRQVEVLIFWREAKLSLSGQRHDVIVGALLIAERRKRKRRRKHLCKFNLNYHTQILL